MIYIQILLTLFVIAIFILEANDIKRDQRSYLRENRMTVIELIAAVVFSGTFFIIAMLFIWIGLPTFKH